MNTDITMQVRALPTSMGERDARWWSHVKISVTSVHLCGVGHQMASAPWCMLAVQQGNPHRRLRRFPPVAWKWRCVAEILARLTDCCFARARQLIVHSWGFRCHDHPLDIDVFLFFSTSLRCFVRGSTNLKHRHCTMTLISFSVLILV